MTTERPTTTAGTGHFRGAGAGAVGGVVLMFSSLPTLFKRTNSYTVTFTDAPGLHVPVLRCAAPASALAKSIVGRSNDATGKVDVTLRSTRAFQVRHNETPTLTISLLGSDASIDFIPDEADTDRSGDSARLGDQRAPARVGQHAAQSRLRSRADHAGDARRHAQIAQTPGRNGAADGAYVRAYRDLGHKADADFPALSSLLATTDDFGATARQWRQLGENLNVLLVANEDKITKAIDQSQSRARARCNCCSATATSRVWRRFSPIPRCQQPGDRHRQESSGCVRSLSGHRQERR